MVRRLAQTYACPALERLARQMLFVPPEKRIEQVRRAEKLYDQVEPGVEYPYEFIAYRITGYRSQEEAATPLPGAVILPDLRLLIDAVSRSMPWPFDPSEPVETVEELARRLDVSTKTIARWRRSGLRWRWMGDPATVPGNTRPTPRLTGRPPASPQPIPKSPIPNPQSLPLSRQRLVFPRVGVDRFLAIHGDRVERAASFTRMTRQERARILARAQRIAEAVDASPHRVAAHLARRTGRAVETVRALLERHDQDHPDNPIFADRTRALTGAEVRVIARAYRMGVSVTRMARRFGRTRSTIYRAIHEHRAAALRQRAITFVELPIFARPDADEVILRPQAPDPQPRHGPAAHTPVDDLPESLQEVFRQPALPAQRQRSLLVRYNYLKFKAHHLRALLDRSEPRAAQLAQIEALLREADTLGDRLLLANAALVLSIVRRHLTGQDDAAAPRLLELLDQGQDVLVEAVETYDPARGQTFESFLTWLLLRHYATRQVEPRARAHRRSDPATMLARLRRALTATTAPGGMLTSS